MGCSSVSAQQPEIAGFQEGRHYRLQADAESRFNGLKTKNTFPALGSLRPSEGAEWLPFRGGLGASEGCNSYTGRPPPSNSQGTALLEAGPLQM